MKLKIIIPFVCFFALLAGFLFIDLAQAQKPTTLSSSLSIEPGAQEINTDFEYNGFGVSWSKQYTDPQIKINNVSIESMEASGKKSDYFFSDPIFEINNVFNIETNVPITINYFDSRPTLSPNPIRSLANTLDEWSEADDLALAQSNQTVDIITREEWGADENYRFWEPEYTEPKLFVIHHTAGSDGGEDPAATVRGIYYYHAQILGWGDIGYNYLIDKNGQVYEGRYGGDKVIGAHAYNDYTATDYNQNTIGISILGCYEDSAACSTISEYTPAIEESLSSLIAQKASDLNINLNGQRTLQGEMFSAVIGHRDVDYTVCPGSIIYDQLSTILDLAQSKYSTLQIIKSRKAKIQNHSFSPAYLIDTQENITVTYKNTGERNLPANKVYLKVTDNKTNQKKKIYLQEKAVVGDEFTFTFPWDFDTRGEHEVTLKLYRNEKQYINKSRTKITYRVDSPYHAVLKNNNLPTAVLEGWNPKITLNYKNKGTSTWHSDDTALYVNGKFVAYLNEKNVSNPSRGNFTFNLQDINNLKAGKNKLIFQLWQDGHKIKNSRFVHKIRIDKN